MSFFVSNNGDIVSVEEYSLRSGNRGHLYGDGVFESIRVLNGKVLNLKNHLSRMIDGMKALKIEIPTHYKKTEFFQKEIEYLLQKNKITKGGKVRLSIDRNNGGNYFPISNSPSFFIETYPIKLNNFILNEHGLIVDIYKNMKKQNNVLSPYKTKNCLIYVMASLYAKEKGFSEMLITNCEDYIIESSSSNLFLVSNGVLYTSRVKDGCLAGTMRMQIINLAIENKIKVYEYNILSKNLLMADEVFLTNAIQGIRWVSEFKNKKYINKYSKKFIQLLNNKVGFNSD